MKQISAIMLMLLSSVSLTSCRQKETAAPSLEAPHAAKKNIIYLHQIITKADNTESVFNNYTKSGNVIVDFYAEWCGPCKMMSRVIDQIATQFPHVTFLKVDTDQFQSLTSAIRSIPTIVFYKEGKEVTRLSGARDKSDFIKLLNQYF